MPDGRPILQRFKGLLEFNEEMRKYEVHKETNREETEADGKCSEALRRLKIRRQLKKHDGEDQN